MVFHHWTTQRDRNETFKPKVAGIIIIIIFLLFSPAVWFVPPGSQEDYLGIYFLNKIILTCMSLKAAMMILRLICKTKPKNHQFDIKLHDI